MEYFHVHHRLFLISIFFIVSTLATTEDTTSSPGPSSPTLQPVSSSNAVPDSSESSSPTSSPLPSLIHVGAPPSPRDGSRGSPASQPGEVPLSVESDAPESHATVPTYSPGPSPILMPVSSPNAEPELSPTSSPLPPNSPDAVSEESPEGPDGELPVSVQSDAAESESEESETEPDSDAEESESESDSEPKKGTANANTEVKKVCESTDYPSLCINTIGPLVKPKKEVSLDTVLEVSITATNDLTKTAQAMVKKLANAPGTPPELASVLKVCEGSYDDALDNLQKAMEAYDTKDVGTMNSMLSAVITFIGDCNDEFSSLNIPSPMAEFADKLANMTSNCLAIVSLL